MTLTLELSEQLGAELAVEAERLGIPLSEYALRVLLTGRTPLSAPKTGTELVAYWKREGLIGTHPETSDSPEYARQLREQAQRRARE
jgi:hypothetical protein